MAIVHHEGGDEPLAEMLKMMISGIEANDPHRALLNQGELELIERGGNVSREELERVAELWAEMGLPATDVVAEAAEQALPERVLRCPYTPEDRCNYESWQRGYENRQRMQRSK